jgi:NAD(P)-dependent dehydrogenase (short-subunit alcohol dehydrogenase family)
MGQLANAQDAKLSKNHKKSDEMPARTALITGASTGLGAHFAGLLLNEGYNVVLAARRRDRLNDVARVNAAHEKRLLVVEMDVTDEASIKMGFDQACARFGQVHSVIANAGISSGGKAVDLDVDEFDRIMNVNVRGAFLTAREAARRMQAAKDDKAHRSIVLVSSIGGLQPLPGLTAYSASKAAVIMLARGLAREWVSSRINVNAVCPGFIRTELNDQWFNSSAGRKQIDAFPRRRLMEATQLDRIMSFLAGPESDGVTGSSFKIDDGQTLQSS